jgi:regulator of sigma E protease
MTLDAAPALREMGDGLGGVRRVGYLGVRRSSASPDVKVEKFGPMAAIYSGAGQTWFIAEQTLRFIFKLAARGESADQLGGPIKIAQISAKIAATFGLGALIQLAGILSVSVGLLNLFPIPALDGGHLLFYSIEASRGRPVSARAQKWSLLFGAVAILALMIFTTVVDVMRLLA